MLGLGETPERCCWYLSGVSLPDLSVSLWRVKNIKLFTLLTLVSNVFLGRTKEEGIKTEEGASTKEQGEPIELEKENSPTVASAAENEVPMEVSVCQVLTPSYVGVDVFSECTSLNSQVEICLSC